MIEINDTKKCYNSFSCILSVLIVLFVVGSIAYDMIVSKPAMKSSIDDIKIEVKDIREKIDAQIANDSINYAKLVKQQEELNARGELMKIRDRMNKE